MTISSTFIPSDPSIAKLSALAISARTQIEVSNFDALLESFSTRDTKKNTGTGSSSAFALTLDNKVFLNSYSMEAESVLAGGGPLPAFLREVDVRYNLDPTRQKALREITARNMDIVKTPESVIALARELWEAGIY